MKMREENDRYKKITEILRNSRPEIKRPEEVENEVIRRIQRESHKTGRVSEFIESLFGWVYIGWVRRSLVGVAAVIIAVFVYQQTFIFRQVKSISRQVVISGNQRSSAPSAVLDKKLMFYKMSVRLTPEGDISISGRQLEEFLESYNDLQLKYKDLQRLIEEDPELKDYIENKLSQEKKYKPDI